MVCISPSRSLRGVVATKQSQNEIATPFGLAMTTFYGSECKLFYALGNNFIRLVASLPYGRITEVIGRQLLRSGTSYWL